MAKIVTKEFRVSFPHVFKPSGFEGQDPKYSITMLFDKSTDISDLKALATQVAKEKWPKGIPSSMRKPFRDGDEEKPDTDGYANTIFVRASSKTKPGVVDTDLQPILDENDFYGGCYARAEITCFAYDFAGNKGVSFGLNHVQKLRDGDSFSGRGTAEQAFGPVKSEGTTGGAVSADDDIW